MNIKILIATHKQYTMPADDIYLPVRVNNAASSDNFGYQGDDMGDNISHKNPYYCELTVVYWGWKNLKCDYIGLSHYRRYFSTDFHWWSRYIGQEDSLEAKRKQILSAEEARQLCEQYNVILPQRRRYFIETIWNHYGHTHDITHLVRTREIIAEICPSYIPTFDIVMKRTWCHMFNMFLMKKTLADAYCDWLFPILFKLEDRLDTKGLSAFDARLYGRVSELLLDVWIEANHLHYKEIGFVQLGNENWPKKVYSFLMAKFFGKKYTQSR